MLGALIPMGDGMRRAVRRVLVEVHLALLRIGVAPETAQERIDRALALVPQGLMQGEPGTFEPFYVSAWSILGPDEERQWQRLETQANAMSDEEWRLREVEWCRRWLGEHPEAPGTELVLAWEDACGQ